MKTAVLLFWAVFAIWIVNQAIAYAVERKKDFDKKLVYEDYIYDASIKTVLLYPQVKSPEDPSNALNPAVVPFQDNTPLVLEFDLLSERYVNYRAKIFHCNTDWSPSVLSEVEYLPEYNDFPITDYQQAFGTKVPYYHYRFEAPQVKLPGNYLLVVHRDGNPKDYVISRRFMVYQNRVNIAGRVSYSANVQQRNTHQQVDFELSYGGYQILNPREDLKVMIRQNFRWGKVLTNLKPFNVRDFEQKIQYNFFNLENTLPGGNEYRMFDARSYQTKMTNVARIERNTDQNTLILSYDTPQQNRAFVDMNDFNGMYVVDNYETNRGATEADYVRVVFSLKMPEVEGKNIYINGPFNDWRIGPSNRMNYLADLQMYQGTLLLKQGIYNYNYLTEDLLTKDKSEAYLEGSHSQTHNTYEILVYHRPLGARADQLVGYRIVEMQ